MRFTGTLPAGHAEQNNASLMFENPVLLQCEQIPLLLMELWTTKDPGSHRGLNATVNILPSNDNIVDAALRLTSTLQKKAVDLDKSINEGMRH